MECNNENELDKVPVAFKFKVITDQFAAKLNSRLEQDDLTFSQLAIISFLSRNTDHNVSLKELCSACHIKHPTAIGLIKRLEDKGMVKSSVNEANRKFRIIEITDKGKDYFEFCGKRHDKMNDALLSPLTDKQQKELGEMLDLLIENMNSF